MSVSEEKVREALMQVIDPELFVNIVDLGLIYKVDVIESTAVEGNAAESTAVEAAVEKPTSEAAPVGADVLIEMTMTSPACPAGPELLARSKAVTSALDGVRSVDVKLVMTPPWSPDRMTEAARDQLGIF
jgi:metal-sulfur cluster biosynthetic enzyme